jgi:formylglycine-generating enzyme required for sulfatase activity
MNRIALLAVVLASALAALAQQPAGSPAASQAVSADSGTEITVKGPLISAFHFKGQRLDGELVVYAFDGPPEVKITLDQLLDKYYPKEGSVNGDQAVELIKQMDEKVRYYVECTDPKIKRAKGGYECDYGAWLAEVTGKLEVRNGKNWIVNAKINSVKPGPDFKYPPERMLRPNKPFVMPKDPPIDLAIADKLTLKCVPIPPGKFLMGTPFYQWPRYQDECPHKVTLSKMFYMSEIPITQEMWEAVMGADKNVSDNRGPQIPVEFSPMPDIREFCKILSQKNNRIVRLPTAAEMEYAARLGTSCPEPPEKNKNDWVLIGPPLVWKEKAAAVKTKQPNAWGLYDVFTEAKVAVSDWKAYNGPAEEVDPQGAKLEDSIVSRSILKPKKPVPDMIMNGKYPAIHKAVLGGGMKCRPGSHDRYTEDGCDGINGDQWVGIFRIVAESGAPTSASAPTAAPK